MDQSVHRDKVANGSIRTQR